MTWWILVLLLVVAWGLAYAWACWAYVLGYNRADELRKVECDALRTMIRNMDARSL